MAGYIASDHGKRYDQGFVGVQCSPRGCRPIISTQAANAVRIGTPRWYIVPIRCTVVPAGATFRNRTGREALRQPGKIQRTVRDLEGGAVTERMLRRLPMMLL